MSKLLPKIIKFVCAYPNFSKTTIQTTSKLLPKQSSKRCPNYCQNNHLNAHQIVAKTTIQGVSKLLSKQPSKRCPNLCQNNYSNVVQIVVKKHFILISETNNSLWTDTLHSIHYLSRYYTCHCYGHICQHINEIVRTLKTGSEGTHRHNFKKLFKNRCGCRSCVVLSFEDNEMCPVSS